MSNCETEFVICDGILKEYNGTKEKIIIPQDVHTIGKCSFMGNRNVVEIILPSGIVAIEAMAFDSCTNIKSIEIPQSVTEIKSSTFSGCKSLESVKLPNALIRIGNDAFSGCARLSAIAIPSTIEEIGECAFDGCKKLAEISLPSDIRVGYHAFRNTKWLKNYFKTHDALIIGKTLVDAKRELKEYTIPEGVERIGDFAFCCNEAEAIHLPNTLKTIGAFAFSASKIKQMTIPFSVEKIEEQAFCECTELESIFIPETVTIIENQAFAMLPRATITIESADEDMNINESAFCDENMEIAIKEVRAPYGSKSMRCAMRLNIPYVALEGKPQKYTYIDEVFCCKGSTLVEYLGHEEEVFVPTGIEEIGENAFFGELQKTLKRVHLPSSVVKISNFAFMMCETLEEIYGTGVISIAANAFRCCTNLKTADFPNVTEVGYKAFAECSKLEQKHLIEMQPKGFSILSKENK